MNPEFEKSAPGRDATPTGPAPFARFFENTDWFSFGATVVVSLLVYLATLIPSVGLDNAGIFIAGAMYPGVPHPPGYPLWTWWGWLFIKLLPFGSVGWRASFASAAAAALASGMIALMVSRGGAGILKSFPNRLKLGEQRWLRGICGYAAGLNFAVNGAIWPSATTATPWPLSVLLLGIVLCLLFRWIYEPERRSFLYGAAFCYGLLLTNSQIHFAFMPAIPFLVTLGDVKVGRDVFFTGLILFSAWLIGSMTGLFPSVKDYGPGFMVVFVSLGIIAGVAGMALAIYTRGMFSKIKIVIICTACFLGGLAFYLWLPVASMTDPPMGWGYPRTVEGFFHVITRGQYDRMHPTESATHFFGQLWVYAFVTGKFFGWLYLPVVAVPFFFMNRLSSAGRKWTCGLLAPFLFLVALMNLVLDPGREMNNELGPFGSAAYLSSSYVVLAIWSGCGLVLLGILLTNRWFLRHPSAA